MCQSLAATEMLKALVNFVEALMPRRDALSAFFTLRLCRNLGNLHPRQSICLLRSHFFASVVISSSLAFAAASATVVVPLGKIKIYVKNYTGANLTQICVRGRVN